MRSAVAPLMKARYCSASASTEIFEMSSLCVRANASSKSSGPSKPSTCTASAWSGRTSMLAGSAQAFGSGVSVVGIGWGTTVEMDAAKA